MFAERIRGWFENRLPVSDTHTLTQGNIYIVPTKAGFAFAFTLVLMLVASINYQLNLGYLLTFLLAGSALVSMHLTHGTLRGLTLRVKPPAAMFLGDSAEVEVVLTSPGTARHGIGLAVSRARPLRFAWCDVPALGSAAARVRFAPAKRGLVRVPALMAETRFPLGLFRAWTVWRPAAQVLVYPQPEVPPAPLPATQAVPGTSRNTRATDGGEFDGVRSYRRGDAMRRVVWKKAAKTGELVSRDTSESASRELWLDFESTNLANVEARLSRLAAWTLAAEQTGLAFGLRIPGVELLPGQGDGQRRAALEALALW
ncbi:MAG TPA: DUF58 domain-containing protein [Burkholderiaceae bacterium]